MSRQDDDSEKKQDVDSGKKKRSARQQIASPVETPDAGRKQATAGGGRSANAKSGGFAGQRPQDGQRIVTLAEADAVQESLSRNDRFVSVTVTITATSQQQLDAIYQDVTDHDDVLMAL